MDGFEINTNHYKPRKSRPIGTILVVVLLLVGTAAGVWFWRQRDIDSLKKSQNASQSPSQTDAAANLINPEDEGEWSTVTIGPTFLKGDKSAAMSFKLPIGWQVVTCGAGEEAIVSYVSPNEATRAICGTEQGSPILFSAQVGDLSKSYTYDEEPTYKSSKTEKVTINGKSFLLNSGIVDKPLEFGPPTGSVLTSYVYYNPDSGITTAATYLRPGGDEVDLSADFKRIVEETFSLLLTEPSIDPAD